MSLNQEERRVRIKLNQPFAKAVEALRRLRPRAAVRYLDQPAVAPLG